MVQTLKPALRERVLSAAQHEFAASGYAGATMAAIAARAGVSTGNLYRYFENKDALFYEIFTDAFCDTFLALVDKRVRALTLASDLTALDAPARADAAALLRFWIDHRLEVIVVLDRAEGSRFSSFRARFVDALVRPTLAKLRPRGREKEAAARLVRIIFENTVRAIVTILEECEGEQEITEAFAGFWSYQLAGLAGFTKWAAT